MKCQTCKYFEIIDAQGAGYCHRNPPQNVVIPARSLQGMSMNVNGAFALTNSAAWCGEYAEKVNGVVTN